MKKSITSKKYKQTEVICFRNVLKFYCIHFYKVLSSIQCNAGICFVCINRFGFTFCFSEITCSFETFNFNFCRYLNCPQTGICAILASAISIAHCPRIHTDTDRGRERERNSQHVNIINKIYASLPY